MRLWGVEAGRLAALSLVAAAVVAAALAAGCGRKADPLPPQIRRAETTRDLEVFQQATDAVVTWTYPSMTSAGGPLPDLEVIEVWRAEIPLGQEPLGSSGADRAMQHRLLAAQGEPIAVLDDAARDAATAGNKLSIRDDLAAWRAVHGDEQPLVLWYAVRTLCCGGRPSEFSNIGRLVPQLPPSPPEGLEAEPTREGIRLRWLASGNLATIVERTSAEGEWAPLTPEPLNVSEFLDATARQGRSWSYRLRAVRASAAEGRVIGEPGPALSVDYRDVYPPAAPGGLVCLPEEERIILRWEAVRGATAYRIERRVGNDAPVVLSDGVEARDYVDEAPPVGALTYRVLAVDEAGNRSEAAECTALQAATP